MSKITFAAALAAFVTATAASMENARICAELAIGHFKEHGDLCHAQSFLDAMPANYTRRVAYLKWLAAHSPVTMEAGKLLKDKSETATPFDIEGALDKPFWEFAPDTEVVTFDATDIDAALRRVVKRFENANRYKAADPATVIHLAEVKAKLLDAPLAAAVAEVQEHVANANQEQEQPAQAAVA